MVKYSTHKIILWNSYPSSSQTNKGWLIGV